MVNFKRIGQGTSAVGSTGYDVAATWTFPRDPDVTDWQGYSRHDTWLNSLTRDMFILVSLEGTSTSKGPQADWQPITNAGTLETLTGTSGGAVSPDVNANINILGSGVITVVGNPGTNTLTVTPSGDIASSFVTSPATGTATPAAGVLTFAGTGGTTVSAAGSTVTITSTDTGANSFETDSGTATPAAGVITFDAQTQAGQTMVFSGSGSTVSLNTTDAVGNLAIGEDAGAAITTGSENTFVGRSAGQLLTTGDRNIALGFGAGSLIATSGESGNTLIGHPGIAGVGALLVIAADSPGGTPNTQYMHNYPAGASHNGTCLFLGEGAGNFTMSPSVFSNYSLGGATLQSLTTGSHNIAIGNGSLASVTSGGQNVAIGHSAAWNPGGPAGLTTGQNNILIGYTAGNEFTSSESYNIIIGEGNGRAPVGSSQVCSIGFTSSSNDVTKTFIAGIRGTTTDVNNAIAVLIDSAGQLGTISSSIVYKENVEDMSKASAPILNLRPVTFNWKNDPDKDRQYGLIAEEVDKVMPELVAHDADGEIYSVKYQELIPLMLNEIQRLSKEVTALKATISK